MTQLDLLADVQASLTQAMADGQSFESWKKGIQPLLESRGWWGRAIQTDPLTGVDRAVQLGSPRRLKIIYDTNMRMAHAGGAWDRIQSRKADRPWLRYVAVMDEATRDDHRRWHGVILPVDHPFWRTHYPPNGWRCRCHVVQLSDADLERRGWKPTRDSDLDATGWRETRPWTNTRTGDTVDVPTGIDPGFAYNVGTASRVAEGYRLLAAKLEAAPPEIARRGGWSLLKSDAFARFLATARAGDTTDWWPIPAPTALTKTLSADTTIIRLSADTAAKQRGATDRGPGHPEITVGEYAHLPEILMDGEDWPSKAGPLHRARIRMIGDIRYIAVVKVSRDGREIYLTSFRRLRDDEYARLRRKGMAAAGADA